MAFPTSPIVGQVHSEYGNSYYYDGVTWIVGWAKPILTTHVVATGVTPATAAPLMWIDTKTRKLYKQENNEWVFIQDLDEGFGSAPNLNVPITYTITAPGSVNEGSSINIQVQTTGIDNGETISYTITGVSALDIGVPTGGSMLVTNNSASINIPLLADQTTEGGETLNFTVAGQETVQIYINDVSLSPIYNIVASSVSVAEGASASFTVNTQNVSDNTTVNYEITGIEAGDINVPLTGTLTVVSGTAQLQLTPTADVLTEGVQTITFTLVGKGVSSTINILDTSKTPIYEAVASAATSDEGSTVTFTVNTQNVANNTTVDYAITGVEAEDIDVALTGTLTIVSSTASLAVALAADLLTEGTQTMTFTLTGKGVDAVVEISDTSIEPIVPSGMILEATVGAGQETVSIAVAQLNLYPALYPTDTVEIDWGDGTTSSASGQIFSTQTISHTYASTGVYDITVSGGSGWLRLTGYGGLYLTNVLTDIKAWGGFKWTSMNTSFAASKFSTWSATDKPDFSLFVVGPTPSRVGGCPGTFAGNTVLTNPPIGNWDMHLADSSTSMFSGCTNFNGPVDEWTTPGTGNIEYMFSACTNFNKNIGSWDVSGVTGMQYMFQDCPAFNQNIGSWNTANVTTVVGMFRRATNFNQDLSLWNMIKCAEYVKWGAFADEVPLWTQPKPVWGSAPTVSTGMGEAGYPADEMVIRWTGTNFSHMQFYARYKPGTTTETQCEFIFGTQAAKTGSSSHNFGSAGTYIIRIRNLRGMTLPAGWNDILQWPTSQYAPQTQLSYMTNANPTSSRGANAAITAQIGPNLSQTTTLESMFMSSTFNINLSQWDVSFVKTFSYMFYGATGTPTGLSNWDTSAATAMGSMFQGATKFNEDLSGWCVSGIATAPSFFATGATLFTLPKPVWGTCP